MSSATVLARGLTKQYGRRRGVTDVSLVQALMGEPDIMILDEPTNGLEPAEVRTLRQRLGECCVSVVLIADPPSSYGWRGIRRSSCS